MTLKTEIYDSILYFYLRSQPGAKDYTFLRGYNIHRGHVEPNRVMKKKTNRDELDTEYKIILYNNMQLTIKCIL